MILRADARHIPLRDKSVQCVVTSPPYWGLRDYGTGAWEGGDVECAHSAPSRQGQTGQRADRTFTASIPYRKECPCGARRIDRQIGLEPNPAQYVQTMVGMFREVWRVLRDDGTVWLNLGDSYAHNGACGGSSPVQDGWRGREATVPAGLKPKDLCGMPWRVAFALQADGWYLRSDIVWAKPNPMPESVTDRPTRSHEYLFLLSKRATYYYDADAIREPSTDQADRFIPDGHTSSWRMGDKTGRIADEDGKIYGCPTNGRNKRDVWMVNSEPTPEAHFATFPQKLIEPCILAGTSERGCCAECGAPRGRVTEVERVATRPGINSKYGDLSTDIRATGLGNVKFGLAKRTEATVTTLGWRPSCDHDAPSVPCVVFDPFLGSGTVGKVCERLGRRWVGLELSEQYIGIAKKRTSQMRLRLQ